MSIDLDCLPLSLFEQRESQNHTLPNIEFCVRHCVILGLIFRQNVGHSTCKCMHTIM